MAIPVKMPLLSPTMTEGVLAKWNKKQGDAVKSGDSLADVDTDKATLEVEAYEAGTLLALIAKPGQTVAVGAMIAILGKPGEDISALLAGGAAPAAPAPAKAAAPAPAAAPPAPAPAPAKAAAPAATPAPAPAPAAAPAPAGRVRSSPLARKLAKAGGIDFAGIQGSGPGGRIIKRDVESALARPAAKAAVAAPRAESKLLPISSMRRVIADRLVQAKREVPHFYLTVEIDMEKAVSLRAELKAAGLGITVNDFIVKACGVALQKVPNANRSWTNDGILQHATSDVGVAVALEDGLITPIIRNADQKALSALSTEVKTLAEKARNRKLLPEDYTGGSMSVSNLGMYGVDQFIAVINPPQSTILAVGAVAKKPCEHDGQLALRQRMSATLSCDHRVVDGAVGAQLLAEIKRLLESPILLGF